MNLNQLKYMIRETADNLNKYLLNEKFSYGAACFTHFIGTNNHEIREHYQGGAHNFIINVIHDIFPNETFNDEIIQAIITSYLGNNRVDVPFRGPDQHDFTFIDLFAGIGGFRIALQENNGECVFSSEWDKWSKRTYYHNYEKVPFGDITQIQAEQVPEHDILTAGFPCQPFSLAGVSKKNSLGRNHGFLDETQGTLFFDVVRIIDQKRPSAVILENVKNLRSHDRGKTFEVIMNTLDELGYECFEKIIDARHYVPQHRERIFIVCFNRDLVNIDNKFNFPESPREEYAIGDILSNEVDPKYTLSDKLWNYLQEYARKHRERGNGFGFSLVNLNGVSRTLSARYHKDGSEILIPQFGRNPRRLTPIECRDLMGYPEEFTIDDIGVSDTQLYRQFGNSVAVPVVRAVASEVINYLNQNLIGEENVDGIQVNQPNVVDNRHRIIV